MKAYYSNELYKLNINNTDVEISKRETDKNKIKSL
jgi:hypothetical protein